jgi:ABC-type uncharacterized transport system involved in gliding motility auxiliary subunit
MEKEKNSRRGWKLSGSVAGILVLLVILIALNVMVKGIPARKDFTGERLYTLSDGTRSLLKKLDCPVTLKFFFNSSSTAIPIPLKDFALQVEDLLREYERAGHGKVVVEKYDPKPDSDAEEWAQQYGVNGQPLGPGGESLYFGVVAVAADAQAVIPVIDPGQ